MAKFKLTRRREREREVGHGCLKHANGDEHVEQKGETEPVTWFPTRPGTDAFICKHEGYETSILPVEGKLKGEM